MPLPFVLCPISLQIAALVITYVGRGAWPNEGLLPISFNFVGLIPLTDFLRATTFAIILILLTHQPESISQIMIYDFLIKPRANGHFHRVVCVSYHLNETLSLSGILTTARRPPMTTTISMMKVDTVMVRSFFYLMIIMT